MNEEKTCKYLSVSRFGRYLFACRNDVGRAQSLYKANLLIASRFHPLLGVIEVALRNSLDRVLSRHFDDPDWILHRTSLIWKTIELYGISKNISRSEDVLKNNHSPITAGRIIAEQPFNTWTMMFQSKTYGKLNGIPIQAFPNRGSKQRREIENTLTQIRKFRNRINHNEPICFKNSIVDLSYVTNIHQHIVNALQWIDPDLYEWVKDMDTVELIIKKTNIANAQTPSVRH
ncbi:MAG: hypothetical protein DYG96_16010 [Chlorobi bacterium CHB2]|nr:hypothetical protein [Chlorobi bacterium CHB2]